MSWETAWAEAEVARRFVRHLSELPRTDRRPALAPVLDRDPYLSAWSNVQAALGSAPPADQARLRELIAELDSQVESLDMPPSLREAGRRGLARTARPPVADDPGKPPLRLRAVRECHPARLARQVNAVTVASSRLTSAPQPTSEASVQCSDEGGTLMRFKGT